MAVNVADREVGGSEVQIAECDGRLPASRRRKNFIFLLAVDSTVSPTLLRSPHGRTVTLICFRQRLPSLLAWTASVGTKPDRCLASREILRACAWQHDVFSAGDRTVDPAGHSLYRGQTGHEARRHAARLRIRSVLPMDLTPRPLRAAIRAAAAGFTIALEPPLGDREEFDET